MSRFFFGLLTNAVFNKESIISKRDKALAPTNRPIEPPMSPVYIKNVSYYIMRGYHVLLDGLNIFLDVSMQTNETVLMSTQKTDNNTYILLFWFELMTIYLCVLVLH